MKEGRNQKTNLDNAVKPDRSLSTEASRQMVAMLPDLQVWFLSLKCWRVSRAEVFLASAKDTVYLNNIYIFYLGWNLFFFFLASWSLDCPRPPETCYNLLHFLLESRGNTVKQPTVSFLNIFQISTSSLIQHPTPRQLTAATTRQEKPGHSETLRTVFFSKEWRNVDECWLVRKFNFERFSLHLIQTAEDHELQLLWLWVRTRGRTTAPSNLCKVHMPPALTPKSNKATSSVGQHFNLRQLVWEFLSGVVFRCTDEVWWCSKKVCMWWRLVGWMGQTNKQDFQGTTKCWLLMLRKLCTPYTAPLMM